MAAAEGTERGLQLERERQEVSFKEESQDETRAEEEREANLLKAYAKLWSIAARGPPSDSSRGEIGLLPFPPSCGGANSLQTAGLG